MKTYRLGKGMVINMKKTIVNVFATTGISLLMLAIVALFFQAKCIFLQTVFQVFGINILAHFALFCIRKLEIKYSLIEILLEIILIIILLLVFASIFHWFTSTPIWTLTIMGFAIYIVSALLNILYMRQEALEINALLKRRNSKEKE